MISSKDDGRLDRRDDVHQCRSSGRSHVAQSVLQSMHEDVWLHPGLPRACWQPRTLFTVCERGVTHELLISIQNDNQNDQTWML